MFTSKNQCDTALSCLNAVSAPEKLTVKLQISETEAVAQIYPNAMTIAELKLDLGSKFDVDPNILVVCQSGSEVKDTVKLEALEKNEFGLVEVFLKIDEESERAKHSRLDPQTYYSKHKLPDFITVTIPNERSSSCPCNNIIVEIENATIKKPYLGGHRDLRTDFKCNRQESGCERCIMPNSHFVFTGKEFLFDNVSGKEYFDAFTQTGPLLDRIKFEGIQSRDSQTVEIRSKSINTKEDHSAQVFGDAANLIYVSTVSDFNIQARPYESFEQKVKREDKIGKIILIQRNWRRYLLWRFICSAAVQHRTLRAEQERRDRKIIDNKARRLRNDCVTTAFPRTKEDFDLLFAQVQRWKDAEINRINSMYSGGPRIAELHCLLDKEVQLLNGIERQRALVRKSLKDFRDEQHLQKLGKPVRWIGYQNIVVEMDLLRNQRVRYLTEFFKAMKQHMKKEDRLNLLNKLGAVLQKEMNENPSLSSTILELTDLLDREKNLLVCTKMNNCTLDTLRKRQVVLLTEVIHYEEEYKAEKPESNMCEKCKIVKPISKFALRTRQTSVDICKNCQYMRGTTSDNSLYKAILRCIQRDERKRKTLASYAFIVQEDDIRFIVDKIWHGHSILSKCNDLANLRLPRWIQNEDWSPWNCICLTEAEARVHEHLESLNGVYQDATIQDIQSKHLLAKSSLKKLFDVDFDYVESGHWWKAGIIEKVI